jgi:hypothetical protein
VSADTGGSASTPGVGSTGELVPRLPAIPVLRIADQAQGILVGVLGLGLTLWRIRRWLGLGLVCVLALTWALGLLLFLHTGRGTVTVALPALQSHPSGEHNLVARAYGPVLRASSYFRDRIAQHHPAFLVDARSGPGLVEKWASDPKDVNPWIELSWSSEREVCRVRIEHAGHAESSDFTARKYSLTCLASPAPPALVVTDNAAAIIEHSLHCRGARGVRIDFLPNTPGDLVRVFEIEVWGQ